MTTRALPALCLSLLVSTAHAGTGDALLAQMDANTNKATDTASKMSAKTMIPGKKPLEMVFTLRTKGPKRMVEFQSPGDMKGTRVLVMDRTQMYVFLPAYDKIRRIASHVNNQGFMGTMFADADMSTTRFGDVYDAAQTGETDLVTSLSLTIKAGEKAAYRRIDVDILKSNTLPAELRYFNEKGQHIKTETRTDYFCESEVCQPGVLKMVDHTRNDAWTTLTQTELVVNQGLSHDAFTTRALRQGR
jgi:outer membrane lipoprotein-sorting protein